MSINAFLSRRCAALWLALLFVGVMGSGAAAAAPADPLSASSARSEAEQAVARAPDVIPQETVDQYARRLLEERMAAPETPEAPERLPNVGQVGPVQFELIYITGVGKAARALIRLDKKYAKLAGTGEALAGWTLSDIGADYVDIYKDDKQARVYLFSSHQTVRGS